MPLLLRNVPALLSDSRAETLLKAGKTEHLKYFLDNSRVFDACWQSYKVATRNGYDIEDISIWCDYVDMLRRLGKDIHSPKYVCPTDLHREHVRRQHELRRQREREEKEKRRKKAMEDERRFHELKQNSSVYDFTDGTIQVHVWRACRNIWRRERQCTIDVFSNEYYLKENSLILSATIEGRRIETIEVNLDTLKVVQSRGVCNKNTEYHDQIVSLVNANRKLIRQRMRAIA